MLTTSCPGLPLRNNRDQVRSSCAPSSTCATSRTRTGVPPRVPITISPNCSAEVTRPSVRRPSCCGPVIIRPQQLGLRTLGRVTSAEQFGEIVIGTRGGTPVRVRDVAQVEDGAQELRTWSALFRKGSPGQDVVSIQVLRQSGVNTVRVADDVRSKLDELRAQMPPGVQLQVVH